MSNLISWSASRYDDYQQCPRMTKHKYIDKLCPLCFKGKLNGKFGEPSICDKCGKTPPTPEPLARGSEIGLSLELYVKGKIPALHNAVQHPQIVKLANSLRAAFKKGRVEVEQMKSFDRTWKLLPPGWSPAIWVIVKMDVFHKVGAAVAKVWDWKTGGVDKRSGNKVRVEGKYDDQLELYGIGGLATNPKLEKVDSALAFTDCGKEHDPIIEGGTIYRKDLEKLKKKWAKKVAGMLSDDTFAPKPNDRCRWCAYGKEKSEGRGPCPF